MTGGFGSGASGVDRALVVTAHPDDVDFGAAGTIAGWRREGIEVSYLICTDGEAGGFDRSMERSALARLRRVEQRRAAAMVGVELVEFLGRPDGSLVADLDLRREISRAIRVHRPGRVLCQSPERDYCRLPVSHPDHLAAGSAALDAVYPDARNPFAFPELLAEGLEPHSVTELWLMAHPTPNHYVDITDQLELKIAAVRAHESQLSDPEAIAERIRSFTRINATDAGIGTDRHAEAFYVTNFG